MKTKLVCRKLEKKDEAQLSELHKEVFGVVRDRAFWDWKYYQNPAGEHAMYVAIDPASGSIVGEHGTIPMRIKVGDVEGISTQGVDIVILPQYQKGGPFFRLHELATEEASSRAAFTYAFSIKKTYRIFTRLLHFKGVCPVKKFVKVLNPTPFLQKKIRVPVIAALCGRAGKLMIRFFCHRMPETPGGLELFEVKEFDSTFDEFWQQHPEKQEIMIIRDAQYLNWRYMKNPAAQYTVYALRETKRGSIKGYIVLRTVQEDIRRGYIVDILVDEKGEDLMRLLVSRAIHHCYAEDADSVTCWMLEHTPVAPVLKRMGFEMRGTPHDLMICPYSEDTRAEYLIDVTKWYMTMGDSDYI